MNDNIKNPIKTITNLNAKISGLMKKNKALREKHEKLQADYNDLLAENAYFAAQIDDLLDREPELPVRAIEFIDSVKKKANCKHLATDVSRGDAPGAIRIDIRCEKGRAIDFTHESCRTCEEREIDDD